MAIYRVLIIAAPPLVIHVECRIWNVRGLNKRDHQLALKDLVVEFRLQFIGLLQTCVHVNNITRIQLAILPPWKLFVDLVTTGNCIWIAWDDDVLDVIVLELGAQFIHCRVCIRAVHETVLITVIYGANDVAVRRELWGSLSLLAPQCEEMPWLVDGDFNSLRDLSEVCGPTGDIRLVMEEFNACIMDTGLLPLPM
ncbi:UNVERIFIED_CONTAM: hypothetical protein Sindi_1860600 [Sesamum indicum]